MRKAPITSATRALPLFDLAGIDWRQVASTGESVRSGGIPTERVDMPPRFDHPGIHETLTPKAYHVPQTLQRRPWIGIRFLEKFGLLRRGFSLPVFRHRFLLAPQER